MEAYCGLGDFYRRIGIPERAPEKRLAYTASAAGRVRRSGSIPALRVQRDVGEGQRFLEVCWRRMESSVTIVESCPRVDRGSGRSREEGILNNVR